MWENKNVYSLLVGEHEGKNAHKYSMAPTVPIFKEFTAIKQISVCMWVCIYMFIYIYVYIHI